MNKISKIIIVLLLSIQTFVFVEYVHAEPSTNDPTGQKTEAKLETPVGQGTSAKEPLVTCGGINADGSKQEDCNAQDFVNLVQAILNLMFKFSGFVVAGMFMYAGFLLITSVGDPGKINKAKTIFKRTVVENLFKIEGENNNQQTTEVQNIINNIFK